MSFTLPRSRNGWTLPPEKTDVEATITGDAGVPTFAPRNEHIDPCVAMWLAVIRQCVADATPEGDGTPNRMRRARRWLLENNDDFPYVCGLAGVDHDTVRRQAARAIAERDAKWPDHATASGPRRSPTTAGAAGSPVTAPASTSCAGSSGHGSAKTAGG